MTRIVLVVPAFPQLSESFIVSKFLGLLEGGWDVHVVCRRSSRSEWARFPELGQRPHVFRRVHVVWAQKPRWLAAALLPLALLRTLFTGPGYWRRGWPHLGPRLVKQSYFDAELIALKPDLVHFEFGSLAVERMYLRQLLTCPITVSFRGYDLNYVGLEKADFYAPIWQKADGLHLLGNDLWQRAQKRGCPPDKLHVLIPPAIDTDFFKPGQERSCEAEVGTAVRPLRILSVGRLTWVKGYEYALQAIKQLAEQDIDVEYRLVGGGPYHGPLAFMRHELGLEKCVQLLGPQPQAAILDHLAWADIFLHTAVSEGFGNAVLEAQAMQLPVVCSDAGGLPENVVNGKTGFVVPRRSPQALAEKLICLAHNPDLRQRMGRAGRQRVQTHFQLQDQIEAFDQFFSQVLAA